MSSQAQDHAPSSHSTPLPMVSTGGQSEKQGCWRRFKDAVREQYWVFTPLPASWTFYSFTPPQGAVGEVAWGGGSFLLLRLVLCLYWWFWLLTSSVGSIAKVKVPPLLLEYIPYGALYLIYFTHWTALLEGFYLLFALVAAVWPPSPSKGRVGLCVGVLVWFMREVLIVGALSVTVLYWGLIFPIVGNTDVVDVHLHAVNSLLVLLDVLLCPLPVFVKHCWAPLLYLVAYLFFSVLYWGLGGTNAQGQDYIYPPLDYDKPLKATLSVLATFLLLFPALVMLGYGAHRLGVSLRGRYASREGPKAPSPRALDEEAKAIGTGEHYGALDEHMQSLQQPLVPLSASRDTDEEEAQAGTPPHQRPHHNTAATASQEGRG